ncbi:MAG: DUF4297 domain-containing protein [Clostridia bacterium]|nr:DUF4297 domain-containing protein [Clostridia bacterium]
MENEIIKKLNIAKPREFSGANTVNAYSFQLDICAYLILELVKQKKDFVALVDYLDDIVILDDEKNPTSIIFYQVKTSKNEISISQIISNNWLSYMETNLNNFKGVNAKSIFLTDSTIEFYKRGLKTSQNYSFSDYTLTKLQQYLEYTCTPADKALIETKIKSNLTDSTNYNNLYISRTKFTTADHENQLLAELTNYLQEIDNRIDLAALKSIYDGFVSKLRSLCGESYKPPLIDYEDLKLKKGFRTSNLMEIFNRVKSMMIPIDFQNVYNFATTTLNYSFNKNFIKLKEEYRDFGLYAQKNQATYSLILNTISQIDISSCNTSNLFETIYNVLNSNETISQLELFKKYYEYIIIIFIYKV